MGLCDALERGGRLRGADARRETRAEADAAPFGHGIERRAARDLERHDDGLAGERVGRGELERVERREQPPGGEHGVLAHLRARSVTASAGHVEPAADGSALDAGRLQQGALERDRVGGAQGLGERRRSASALLLVDRERDHGGELGEVDAVGPQEHEREQARGDAALVVRGSEPAQLMALVLDVAHDAPGRLDRVDVRDDGEQRPTGPAEHEVRDAAGRGDAPHGQPELAGARLEVADDRALVTRGGRDSHERRKLVANPFLGCRVIHVDRRL